MKQSWLSSPIRRPVHKLKPNPKCHLRASDSSCPGRRYLESLSFLTVPGRGPERGTQVQPGKRRCGEAERTIPHAPFGGRLSSPPMLSFVCLHHYHSHMAFECFGSFRAYGNSAAIWGIWRGGERSNTRTHSHTCEPFFIGGLSCLICWWMRSTSQATKTNERAKDPGVRPGRPLPPAIVKRC